MAFDDSPPSTLRDYLDIFWRRKWIILQAVILVPAAAMLWSSRQPAVYEASANVLVNTQNVAANLSGITDPTQTNATRVLTTQVELARVPEVAGRAVKSAGLDDWSGPDLLAVSGVTSSPDSDVMRFVVRADERAVTVKLVNEYARQFTLYRLELDTDALEAAIAAVETRMRGLEEAGREDSRLYASMADRRDSLDTLSTLQTSRATVVEEALAAVQVEPKPRQTGLLALLLGIALGLGIAFLRESLDTRIRSVRGISDRLGLPILGRLPRPPRQYRQDPHLATVSDAYGPHAETFRLLMSNIDLVNLDHGAQSIMLTSAHEQEGKSTTAANLAVAFARAGKRVVLVDFDVRSPSLHHFFGLDQTPGLTEVTTYEVPLHGALQPIDLGPSSAFPAQHNDSPSGSGGTLRVLTSGAPVPDPAWIAGKAFGSILERVKRQCDLVIVDGPPLLMVGDAVEASAQIDALLVVARLNHVRRPMLDELERALRQSPTIKLGIVATDADSETGYGYVARPYYRQKTAG